MIAAFNFGTLALGTSFFLAGLAVGWRSASLRTTLFAQWDGPAALARNGLSEKAGKLLVTIQKQIGGTAVEGGAIEFDPLRVKNDPGILRDSMDEFLKCLSVRDSVDPCLRALLAVGPAMLVADALFLLGLSLVVLHAGEIVTLSRVPLFVGWATGVLGVMGLLACFAVYAYLQHRLSGAEILAKP